MTAHVLARLLILTGLTALVGTALVHLRAPSGQPVSTQAGANASRPADVPEPGPYRTSDPLPARALAAAPQPPATAAAAPPQDPAPVAPAAEPSVAAAASATPGPRAALVSPARAQPGEAAAVSVAPPAALVDINTASVDELNGLGGRFGKAIIRGRPYRSIEDLVSKRILTRAVFNRIKDRIAAR